jgi:hypothetical protein
VSSLSEPNSGGLALQSNDGKSIYHFGGKSSRTIHKFDIETNLTVLLPTVLPSSVYVSSGVSNNRTHFIFSGQAGNVLEFSEQFQTVKVIADLPFDIDFPVLSTAAIPTGNDGVWLFAGQMYRVTNPVLLFNLTNKVVYNQVANTSSLPILYQVPASVSDGKHGYLIGALNIAGDYHPTNGILR